MKRLSLTGLLLLFIAFVSLAIHADERMSTITADDGVIRVGLDCDARSKSLHVLTALFNANDKDDIYLLKSNLSLTEYTPHVYTFISDENFDREHSYRYAAPYSHQIEAESDSGFSKEARFILPPGEEVIVRDPVSRFYTLDLEKKYHVTSYFGFLSEHDTHIFSSKLSYIVDPACFTHEEVLWLKDVQVETHVLRVPD